MNKRTKKRVGLAAVIVLLLAVAAVAATLAAPNAKTTNVITTGKVDIQLLDKTVEGETPVTVMPGVTVEMPVSVRNAEGAAAAYVRVKLEAVELTMADGTKQPVDAWDDLVATSGTASGNWLDGGDGWLYYMDELPACDEGETIETEEVTLSISFNGPDMGNEYQGAQVDTRVVAHAVQAKNNDIPEGGDVTDAFKDGNDQPINILPNTEWVDEPAEENDQEGGSDV